MGQTSHTNQPADDSGHPKKGARGVGRGRRRRKNGPGGWLREIAARIERGEPPLPPRPKPAPAPSQADIDALLDPDRPGLSRCVADLLRVALGTHDFATDDEGNAHVWRLPRGPRSERPPCGARCRDGHACRAKAVPGGARCRVHGGLSTGPRAAKARQTGGTAEGAKGGQKGGSGSDNNRAYGA